MVEHSTVVLTHDLPAVGLERGDVGTVVHVYADGVGVEVEFVSGNGETVAVATLNADDVRPLRAKDILHARAMDATAPNS